MSPTAPGVLIGSGRECDVFDIGNNRALRRSRKGRTTETEALTMQHARHHGYPVPEVFDADGSDIVMERIHGFTMVEAFSCKPWKVGAWARLLAELIDQLATLPLPEHVLATRFEAGDTLTHGDLHPLNVMLTADGPIVIDWADASVAPAGVDAALTWITMASADIDGSAVVRTLGGVARSYMVRAYVGAIDRDLAMPHLQAAFDYRAGGSNIQPGEVERMRSFMRSIS